MVSGFFMKPEPNETICLISYEVTSILLGGPPEVRPSFWKTYRDELAYNTRTGYVNTHVEICRNQLLPLRDKLAVPHYYRHGRLVTEKERFSSL